ncbi:MAG: DUF2155 domain-containing protein [Beijerinckiaceae bacterium]|nr:DUF2155 domain-containing protein [Beijerinckiaceae bacterium]
MDFNTFLSGRLRPTRLMILAAALAAVGAPAHADKIKNPTAVFAGLDKITGRIISFEVGVDETVQFGSLQLTPKVCYSRPTTETPQTDSFIEVDEINASNEYKRVFSGWVFASSPGLSAIEHPVYDLWLTECKGGTTIIKTAPEEVEAALPPPKSDLAPGVKPDEALKRAADEKAARERQALRAAAQTPSQRFFPTNVPPPARGGGGSLPTLPLDPTPRN